uniref:RING-type domain-containing protein n=1 Tax=Caenorhabditis tropicalis TaxID=1561998 RepID=A0A1I7TDN0_9PELO
MSRWYRILHEYFALVEEEEREYEVVHLLPKKSETELKKEKKELEEQLKELKKKSAEKAKIMKFAIDGIKKMKRRNATIKRRNKIAKEMKKVISDTKLNYFDAVCCPVCRKTYTENGRAPKVISCGDTMCEKCVKSIKRARCPICSEKKINTNACKENITMKQILF